MASVARFARHLKQPKGGYIPIKNFQLVKINEYCPKLPHEKLPPGYPMVEGICTETIIRVANGMDADGVLNYIFRRNDPGTIDFFPILTSKFRQEVAAIPDHGFSDDLVVLIYRLFQFSWWYLPRRKHILTNEIDEFEIKNPVFIPTKTQIANIKQMAINSTYFEKFFGPMDFNPIDLTGGFTKVIRSGEIDFRTRDTIWEIKESINKPTPFHTMQVLTYFLIEKHSDKHDKNLHKIGIFNPRLCEAYILDVKNIDPELIQFIEQELIGYK